MKTKLITILLLLTMLQFYAQDANPFYVGHSLVNHHMPHMVQSLAAAAGKTTHYNKQIINGSTIWNQFTNYGSAQGTPYPDAFPDGNHNTLVLTEAVPLQNHLTWSNSYTYANSFYDYVNNNNDGQAVNYYLYETWHCINSGIPLEGLPTGCHYDNSAHSNTLWHPRLLLDFPLWTGIVDSVRQMHPNADNIWMVPAGQAFYNLKVEIDAGNVPGLSDVFDLFSDDIHLTNAGNYFVACVIYASIYKSSPEGLTTGMSDEWGTPFNDMPTPAQAQVMQEVAWNTVTSLSEWTGVSVPDNDLAEGLIAHYPFSGTAEDESENANHGSLQGAVPSPNRFGVSAQAYAFDGVDDAIIISSCISDLNAISAFTWSSWFSTMDSPQNNDENLMLSATADMNSSASGNAFRIGIASNGGIYISQQAGQGQIKGSGWNDNLDHHLVVSLKSTGMAAVYVDNNLVDSFQLGTVNWANLSDAYISGQLNNGSLENYFEGTIDEVRLYNRILGGGEIDALYDEGCIQEYLAQDLILNANTVMYARDHIELDNVVVDGNYILELKAPQVTVNPNCTFANGASFRVVNEDGCINN